MKSPTRTIKCRYCEFRIRPIYRNKAGEVKSGFVRLTAHINYHHASQYQRDMAKLKCHPIA